jgi:hypothetical protein
MSQTTSLVVTHLALALMNLLDLQILNTTALLNVHLPFANNQQRVLSATAGICAAGNHPSAPDPLHHSTNRVIQAGSSRDTADSVSLLSQVLPAMGTPSGAPLHSRLKQVLASALYGGGPPGPDDGARMDPLQSQPHAQEISQTSTTTTSASTVTTPKSTVPSTPRSYPLVRNPYHHLHQGWRDRQSPRSSLNNTPTTDKMSSPLPSSTSTTSTPSSHSPPTPIWATEVGCPAPPLFGRLQGCFEFFFLGF